jgi:hypothetical protein
MRAVVREVPPPAIPGTFCRCPSLPSAAGDEGAVVRMDLDELVEHWTLLDDEQELVAGKRGPSRLGFALLLKFYPRTGRFPFAQVGPEQVAVAPPSHHLSGARTSYRNGAETSCRNQSTGR